jgi:hypothetical protein
MDVRIFQYDVVGTVEKFFPPVAGQRGLARGRLAEFGRGVGPVIGRRVDDHAPGPGVEHAPVEDGRVAAGLVVRPEADEHQQAVAKVGGRPPGEVVAVRNSVAVQLAADVASDVAAAGAGVGVEAAELLGVEAGHGLAGVSGRARGVKCRAFSPCL